MADALMTVIAPALFALLCWWFGTGAILWLVRRPPATFAWSMAALTVLLALSFWTARISMRDPSEQGAYLAFASVIVMWSWHEMAFLTGWLAGPRRRALDAGLRGWPRFVQSTQAVLWHELALAAHLAVLWWMQPAQGSHVALCTFAVLWFMRFSAKLNLFLGVPETGEQYLPARLRYLASYFRRGPLSLFFFLSVGVSIAIWVVLVWQAQHGQTVVSTGWVLLAALLGLAIVEHLIMAFPTPMQKLWSWAMP